MMWLVLCFVVAISSTCLVPDEQYPFPNNKITSEYFQWLRQISDARTKGYFAKATPAQMNSFLDARVSHIFQHLNNTVGPHTVCLPQDFEHVAIQTDVEHWLIDYQYLHRLMKLFPHTVTESYAADLEVAFSEAMRPKGWN
eukprot:TRINITY_DN1852_c0_g1_i2.p3 TRINITY_DN1852_c0_g1~~TRINITY_DN1852_c0_g1_i2.p3  ORF type:complete len:141 (+),score=19.51 TRINITY_DN1852_c0_g1_i2:23-445(+)